MVCTWILTLNTADKQSGGLVLLVYTGSRKIKIPRAGYHDWIPTTFVNFCNPPEIQLQVQTTLPSQK